MDKDGKIRALEAEIRTLKAQIARRDELLSEVRAAVREKIPAADTLLGPGLRHRLLRGVSVRF